MAQSPKSKKQKLQLLDEVNALADEINDILDSKRTERYFEGIATIHSFIEGVLKWMVFIQILWNKSDHVMPKQEVRHIRRYCNQLNFYSLINVALTAGLVDYKLFKRLDAVRVQRNEIVHEYWIYIHKGHRGIFRKKLAKLASVANELVSCLNKLVDETGASEDFIFEISTGRNLLAL